VQINWIHNMLNSQYASTGVGHYSVMDIAMIRYQIEF
jgi:hypothetical protein